MSLFTILAIVILVLSCLHITYQVTYPSIKNKLSGAKQKAAEAQAKAEAQTKLIIQLQQEIASMKKNSI